MSGILLNQIRLDDTLQWLKTLPANCVDLVLSSPPYNLGKEYEAKVALRVIQDASRDKKEDRHHED